MRILLIEDEPKTVLYLKKGLSENGFIVDSADNGIDGKFLATDRHYDLIILDVMLPKMDGWTIINDLRQQKLEIPVLFLTARDSVQERVKGLESGADDYLVKPFAFSELLARIRTVLRRSQTNVSETFMVDDLVVDPIQHKATRNGERLNLTPKEFALLLLFIRRKGQVISRTIIAEQVWDINFDSDTNIVDVMVRRLRQKVDDPFSKKLIHTIRSVGYILEERYEI